MVSPHTTHQAGIRLQRLAIIVSKGTPRARIDTKKLVNHTQGMRADGRWTALDGHTLQREREAIVNPTSTRVEFNAIVYGKSITDPCLGWEKTERLILDLADRI